MYYLLHMTSAMRQNRIKLHRLQKSQKHIWDQNHPRVPLCALDCMIPPLCLSNQLNHPLSDFPKTQGFTLPKLLIVLKATTQHRIDRQSTNCLLLISRFISCSCCSIFYTLLKLFCVSACTDMRIAEHSFSMAYNLLRLFSLLS